jgi:protein-S-isoprenylcysteine O-methyltransferase Ste14
MTDKIEENSKPKLTTAQIERIKLRGTFLNSLGVTFFGSALLKFIFDVSVSGNPFGIPEILVILLFVLMSVGLHALGWQHLSYLDAESEPKELAWPFGIRLWKSSRT